MIRALLRRPARAVGLLLFALGMGVFFFKVEGLGLPLLPADSNGSWLVELRIDARGQGGRGSVRAAFPSSDGMQRVDDAYRIADRLEFSVRDTPGGRLGIWSGQLDGVHQLSAAFRLQLVPLSQDPDEMGLVGDVSPLLVPSEIGVLYGRPEPDLPSGSRAIEDLLESLRLPPGEDGIGRVRTVFAFVADEVATERTGSNDALLTLSAHEGNEHGKARLLVTALRGAGFPARVIRGLRIDSGSDPLPATWCEVYVGERWLVLSPTLGFFGNRPRGLVALSRGTAPLVEGTGVTALSYRYRALRERFEPEDLALLMTPATPWLNAISLYRLPLETQAALRVLLLLPAGALVLAVLRNLVGLPAFGTFLPILVAFSFRSTDLLVGLLLVASVLVFGGLGRLLLDRLYLLLVPRLCIILCLVILTLATFAVLGRELESRALFGGVVFPVVILSMLIERFSITAAEEGFGEAFKKLGWTTLIALLVYPVLQSPAIENAMFGFPELVIAIMGLMVLIGDYTGFRLFELVRFRALTHEEEVLP
jgi:hypothetical protein